MEIDASLKYNKMYEVIDKRNNEEKKRKDALFLEFIKNEI